MSSEQGGMRASDPQGEPFLYIATNGDGRGNGDAAFPLGWNLQSGAAKANSEQREKEAHERGLKEGEARAQAACEPALAAAKQAISTAVEKFKAERQSYFQRIEPEVVQLALAIARKILHREAQMDPLLLAGMVHVALEKIDKETLVRLRANPADVSLWKEHFAQPGSFQPAPELVGDAALARGECTLETEVSSTQVSLETQFKEIEQGFFDLLEQRPRIR
jgi:flagellar assembly protein FliH